MPLPHDVILMQDMTEEVPIIELVNKCAVQVRWQGLKPVLVIAPECDVESDNVLHFISMHSAVAHRGAGDGKAMQEGCLALLLSALEEGTLSVLEKFLEKNTRLIDSVTRHLQQKMVLVSVTKIFHSSRKVTWAQPADRLKDTIA